MPLCATTTSLPDMPEALCFHAGEVVDGKIYAIGGTAANGIDYVKLPGQVVIPANKNHRALKPAGIAELNDGGLALARALADEVARAADAVEYSPVTGGGHDA